MEQTSSDFTSDERASLRQIIHHRLLARAEAMLRALEACDLPQTPQDVARHARALIAVSRLFDRLLPPKTKASDKVTEAELESLSAALDRAEAVVARVPQTLNRHQRRKLEAQHRRAG